MKKNFTPKSISVIVLLFLSFAANSQYYNSLNVIDPKKGQWTQSPGNITESKFVIEPKGIYANVDMYLTFSANTQYRTYLNTDTLEIQLSFSLPKGTMICDSWLLINGKWEKALILDRWTASAIYESIVKRRRDPSILTKESANNYKLSVFPMAGTETRSVKISYLLPYTFSEKNSLIELPTNILALSQDSVKKITIIAKEAMGINNPMFPNNIKPFIASTDTSYPNSKQVTLNSPLKEGFLSFDSPLKNGFFATRMESSTENIYQLAFLPSKASGQHVSKKVLLLVHNVGNSSINKDGTLTAGIKSLLYNNILENDSFNIMFQGLNVKKVSEKWLPFDSIESVFKRINSSYYSNYGDFVGLFASGLNFTINEKNAYVLLLSDSYEFNSISTSNAFIEDLNKTYKKLPPISFFDYYTGCNYWYTSSGNYFCGNSYLYGVISRATGGTYIKLGQGESFSGKLLEIGQSLDQYISTFDQVVTLENGFCYGRMQINSNGQSAFAGKPIMTIGKYKGNFPLNIQVSGILNDSVFSNKIVINDTDAITTDDFSSKIWAGNYIEEMETSSSTKNEDIAEIIDYSISNRILSKYTAFLTLEPNMVVTPCDDCNGDEKAILIGIEKQPSADKNTFEVFPNPFTSLVKIKMDFKNENPGDLSIRIFNAMGQLVKTVELNDSGSKLEFTWDGVDQFGNKAPKGTYIIKIIWGNNVKNIKVIKL
jgi:Ca-activated chloride channel family protein